MFRVFVCSTKQIAQKMVMKNNIIRKVFINIENPQFKTNQTNNKNVQKT